MIQNLRYSDTCNKVKSCTKHGRLDQSQRELTVALRKPNCRANLLLFVKKKSAENCTFPCSVSPNYLEKLLHGFKTAENSKDIFIFYAGVRHGVRLTCA